MADSDGHGKRRLASVLGVILLGIGAIGSYVEHYELRGLGDAPVDVTAEDAAKGATLNRRWVRLTDALVPDCKQGLEESNNGVVVGTRVLAADATGEYWFYLRLTGSAGCAAASAPGLQGMLKLADPALPAWLHGKGMNVPNEAARLVELSVGEDPGDVRLLMYGLVGVALLGLALVAVGASAGGAP